MVNRNLNFVAFSLIVLLGTLAFYGLGSDLTTEPANSVSVVDCRNQTYSCEKSLIEEHPTECANNWAPWVPYSQLNCSYTSNNLESVSYIADAANYVTIPRTASEYREEFVTRTGDVPWDIEFLPSETPLWTTKHGELRILENGSVSTVSEIDVTQSGTTGLLGLAIDPEYSENQYVYLFYSYRKANLTDFVSSDANLTDFDDDPTTQETRDRLLNKVSRFKLTEDGLSDEKVLIDQIPSSDHVSGGRLEFGPDGKLYITTSDANLLHKAASKESLAGKVLRMNRDGSVPSDNPFNNSPIYSRGHKNSIGLAWQPVTGNLYNTEHGPWRHDEINHLDPGKNYGWYGYICDKEYHIHIGKYTEYYEGSPEEYFNNTAPAQCFRNWTLAPGGATFVNDTESPWHGDLFIAGLRSKQVYRLKFEEGKVTGEEVFYTSHNEPRISLRIRDVEYLNDSLYVLGGRRGLVKLTPENT